MHVSQPHDMLSRVGTVLAFSVFFGLRAFELFIRVLGRAFGPILLREKSLYELLGKTVAITGLG